MNLDQFLAHLKKVSTKYEWRKSQGCFIRTKDYFSKNRYGAMCPITAVLFSRTKQYVDDGEYRLAGEKLGLEEEIISNIVDAADLTLNRCHDKSVRNLRDKMLTILDLDKE